MRVQKILEMVDPKPQLDQENLQYSEIKPTEKKSVGVGSKLSLRDVGTEPDSKIF